MANSSIGARPSGRRACVKLPMRRGCSVLLAAPSDQPNRCGWCLSATSCSTTGRAGVVAEGAIHSRRLPRCWPMPTIASATSNARWPRSVSPARTRSSPSAPIRALCASSRAASMPWRWPTTTRVTTARPPSSKRCRASRRGIRHFGGGRNLIEAHAPLWIEKKGLRIAVLGYNEFKPRAFEAGANLPGIAWSEDSQVVADIRAARAAGAAHRDSLHALGLGERAASGRAPARNWRGR